MGWFDSLLGGSPSGGVLAGVPAQTPPKWATGLGLFGAALQDAGASLDGKGAPSDHLQKIAGTMRAQQILQALNSTDPATRQQAYAAYTAMGGDAKPFQQAQAAQATPGLMSNLQAHNVSVDPVSGQLPSGDTVQGGGFNFNTPAMSLPEALNASGSPELQSQYAPELIKQQIENQNKAMTTLAPSDAQAAGFRPGAVVQRDAFGNLKVAQASDVKSGDAMKQTLQEKIDEARQVPMTAAQRASNAIAAGNLGVARENLNLKKGGALDDETVDFMAGQILAGDKSAFQNLGRGAQGAQNIVRLRQAVTQKAKAMSIGGSGLAAINAEFSGLQAGERTLGTRTANVEMAATETQNLIPIALAASDKVNRTQYPTLNKILMAAEKGTGDENVVRLGVSVNGLVNTYARAISPTGNPTVSDKDHAREILEAAWSKGQFRAGVDQMNMEIAAARKSPGSVRGEFRAAISGGPSGTAAVPDAPSRAAGPLPSPQSLPRVKTPGTMKIRTYNPATGRLE